MRRIICFVFAVLVASAVSAQDPIKIGVSTALTGDASTYGLDIKNALVFANKKIANGRYQLIFEDDRCSGQAAATVAQKLVSVDSVKYVLGHACSSALLASAPIYERAGVLVISPSASAEAVSRAGDYIFRTWPSDIRTVEVLYDYVASKHKIFGVVSEETEYAQGILKGLHAKNDDGKLPLITENFLTTDADFRSLLGRLVVKKVDGIFLNTQSERTFLALLRQLREIGVEVPVYGVYWPGSATFRKEAGALANGVTYVDAPTVDEGLSAEGKQLLEEFTAEFGAPKYSGFLFATAFEAFRALHEAIESGTTPKEFLYQKTYSGIIGSYSFDGNGDIHGVPMMLKRIEEGKTRNIG